MRITELYNHSIGGRAFRDLQETPEGPAMIDLYELALIDKTTGDQIRIKFDKSTRDHIVRGLTGGVVLAGGELPKL